MAMKLVKKTDEYSIYQRGDKRYAVEDAASSRSTATRSVRILVADNWLKVTAPAKKEPGAEEVAAVEAAAERAPAAERRVIHRFDRCGRCRLHPALSAGFRRSSPEDCRGAGHSGSGGSSARPVSCNALISATSCPPS